MTSPFLEFGPAGGIVVFLFGLVAGSFVNVLIHRLPRGESVAFPGSHCPSCGAAIRAYDNIPVFSWLLLRGRCRACRVPIAIRYPVVELANGLLWAAVYTRAPGWADLVSGFFLCSAALALLAIDAEFRILPDKITLTGTVVGFALSFFSEARTPLSSLGGIVLGAGGLYLVAFLYEKWKKVEGMGMGDVKMLGMIGAFLGPWGVVVAVLLASLAGSVTGLLLVAVKRGSLTTALPFGVFLALGAVAALFWGPTIVELYRGAFR
ncbi:MAG: prepilin peptidase [Acidobacteriota bacterium]|nr:prepilin peptidase [Acidobacteriota bacterium]MDQ5870636.1 prepilin peptidase [Acidobacteriota bacterium]